MGYNFVVNRGYNDVSYIPATFIIALSKMCKFDIIQFLIQSDYIRLLPSTKINTKYYNDTGLTKLEKKDPNLYLMKEKILLLNDIILTDNKVITWVDEHLHLLNRQNFNHYNWSYKNIKITLPPNIRLNYEYQILNVIDRYGDPTIKDYDINWFGYDEYKFAGTHKSIFTNDPTLLKYSNIYQPTIIGLNDNAFSLILADQLLKTVGENDFSDFYKKIKIKKMKLLKFTWAIEFDIYQKIWGPYLDNVIYGYEHISQFKTMFPKATNLLHQIKSGGNVNLPFMGFTKNIKPKILKNDVRISLNEKHPARQYHLIRKKKNEHPAYKRGEIYYKIISLVCQIREVQMMREVWRRLKKCDIIFIPLYGSVVVSGNYVGATHYIINEVLKKHIDKRLKYIIKLKLIK